MSCDREVPAHPRDEEFLAAGRVRDGRAHRPVRACPRRSGFERDDDVAGEGRAVGGDQLAADLSDRTDAFMPRDEVPAGAPVDVGAERHSRRLRIAAREEAERDRKRGDAPTRRVEQLPFDEAVTLDDQIPVVNRVVGDIGKDDRTRRTSDGEGRPGPRRLREGRRGRRGHRPENGQRNPGTGVLHRRSSRGSSQGSPLVRQEYECSSEKFSAKRGAANRVREGGKICKVKRVSRQSAAVGRQSESTVGRVWPLGLGNCARHA